MKVLQNTLVMVLILGFVLSPQNGFAQMDSEMSVNVKDSGHAYFRAI